jgi:hypothetical protein
VIIALYVDDLIPASNSSDLLSKVKAALKENYQIEILLNCLSALRYKFHNVKTVYDLLKGLASSRYWRDSA